MTDVIRLFVGTDERQGPAERALENSLRANTDAEVHITWMRGVRDPSDVFVERPPNEIRMHVDRDELGWATMFSGFRFIVPALCALDGHAGRAIYLDSDMVVLGDIADLWHMPIPGDAHGITPPRSDVIVFDLAKFDGDMDWPSVETILTTPARPKHWLAKGRFRRNIPAEWDHCDRLEPNTKLLHFTVMRTQPWRPWPERFDYGKHPHPDPEACEVFWRYAQG